MKIKLKDGAELPALSQMVQKAYEEADDDVNEMLIDYMAESHFGRVEPLEWINRSTATAWFLENFPENFEKADPEIEPCPSCGSKMKLTMLIGDGRLVCSKCFVASKIGSSKEALIWEWNTSIKKWRNQQET